jgi:hypothetical protein
MNDAAATAVTKAWQRCAAACVSAVEARMHRQQTAVSATGLPATVYKRLYLPHECTACP